MTRRNNGFLFKGFPLTGLGEAVQQFPTGRQLVCTHCPRPASVILSSYTADFPGGSDGKASAYNAGDPGSIPRFGRSPGEGNGDPLQYSCLENPMNGRLQSTGSQRVRTRLSESYHIGIRF